MMNIFLRVCYKSKEAFKANYILKIEPPTEDELLLMSDSQVLIRFTDEY